MLKKEFGKAESILLQHNDVDTTLTMYQDLHRWDESLKVAEKGNHSNAKEFKRGYFDWLL